MLESILQLVIRKIFEILVWLVIILGVSTIAFALSTIVLAVKYAGLKNSANQSVTTTTSTSPTPTQSISENTPEWTTPAPITKTTQSTTEVKPISIFIL